MFEDQFAAIPPNPPRRFDSLPGLRMRATAQGPALALLVVLIALMALIPLSIVAADPTMRLAIGPHRDARGTVLTVAERPGCRGGTAHRIAYRFSVEGRGEFRGAAALCEQSPYYSAKVDDGVQVQFLPGDPSVNMLNGSDSGARPPFFLFLLFPLILGLIVGQLFFPQIGELRRARRLYKNGRIAAGTVVFVKKRAMAARAGWPASGGAEVFVSYSLASGERREGVAQCANDWLLNLLSPGTAVHVAYEDRDPRKVALLEAYLR